MHTLTDRLDDLADDAPTGGAPASEIWARGKRAYRLRAAGLVAAVLMVGAAGAGIAGDLSDRGTDRGNAASTVNVGVALPIDYPRGQELPDLGDSPGPLAAIWVTPGEAGGPQVVGLVAESATFGRLPIDVSSSYLASGSYFALSPDGRRIAYYTSTGAMVVRDLVSGEKYSPVFQFKPRREPWFTWIDATHLAGHDVRGSEADGWVWQPGAPKAQSVNLMPYGGAYMGPYAGQYAGTHPWFYTLPEKGDPHECLSLRDNKTPVLCDVVGVIGSHIALTHDGTGAVVALGIRGIEDETLRHVVATPGAPPHVTFATDLIAYALGMDAGAS